jgi:hypothetical protein
MSGKFIDKYQKKLMQAISRFSKTRNPQGKIRMKISLILSIKGVTLRIRSGVFRLARGHRETTIIQLVRIELIYRTICKM